MNIYRHQFVARCPNNGKLIAYELEIRAERIIHVEHILLAVQYWVDPQGAYHEKIADRLAAQFPRTRQILKAHHHGVDIETIRGEVA